MWNLWTKLDPWVLPFGIFWTKNKKTYWIENRKKNWKITKKVPKISPLFWCWRTFLEAIFYRNFEAFPLWIFWENEEERHPIWSFTNRRFTPNGLIFFVQSKPLDESFISNGRDWVSDSWAYSCNKAH